MIQTVTRRIKNVEYQELIKSLDLIILDEAHKSIFDPIFEYVSEKTGYTAERIRKIIKQNFNVPLKVLVNQIKINKAKTLLRETDMNISEISEFLGFSRIGYFSDVFTSIVGMRPIDYISSIKV
jgi:AraC-like DNA-binding protein